MSHQHLYQTIVQFDKTIVLPRKLATESIHDYLFATAPWWVIIFEVLSDDMDMNLLVKIKMCPTPGWKKNVLGMSQAMVYYLAEGTCLGIKMSK